MVNIYTLNNIGLEGTLQYYHHATPGEPLRGSPGVAWWLYCMVLFKEPIDFNIIAHYICTKPEKCLMLIIYHFSIGFGSYRLKFGSEYIEAYMRNVSPTQSSWALVLCRVNNKREIAPHIRRRMSHYYIHGYKLWKRIYKKYNYTPPEGCLTAYTHTLWADIKTKFNLQIFTIIKGQFLYRT